MAKNRFLILICTLLYSTLLHGYGLPPVNLGLSSFLDGGPLRPRPGFYFQELLVYYTSHRFLDANGHLIGGVPSPQFHDLEIITQAIYQFDKNVLGAEPGISAAIPATLYSSISHNQLGITDNGSGFGDLVAGPYLQWPAINCHGRPILIYRLEVDMRFPIGKNNEPKKAINPGANVFTVNPYWAGTFYFTPNWASSWRLYYLWSSTNHAIHLKAGDTFHMNFTTEYQIRPQWWVGINGYYLHQLQNNKLNGVEVPSSKEQVLGLGAGFLYATSQRYDLVFFGNFYYECNVRNRPQGITALVRFFKYF